MRASLLIALLFVCAPVALRSQVPVATADTTSATTADTVARTTSRLVPPRTVPHDPGPFDGCQGSEGKTALIWGVGSATGGAIVGALLGALPAAALSLFKQHEAARATLWIPTAVIGSASGLIGAGAGVLVCAMEADKARWRAQHEKGELRLTPASPPRRTARASMP
jgi:integral membrane sensor domain MASE1